MGSLPGRVMAVAALVAGAVALAACGGSSSVRTMPASTGAREKTLRIVVPPPPPSPTTAAEPAADCPAPAPADAPARPPAAVPSPHGVVAACLLAVPQNVGPVIDPELLRAAPPGTVFEYVEREAHGTGMGVEARGGDIDISKLNTSAPAAASGAASASGGWVRMGMSLTGGSEGQVVLWVIGGVLIAGGVAASFWQPRYGIPLAAGGGVVLLVAFLMETAPWVIWLAAAALLAVGAVVALQARAARGREEALGAVVPAIESYERDAERWAREAAERGDEAAAAEASAMLSFVRDLKARIEQMAGAQADRVRAEVRTIKRKFRS